MKSKKLNPSWERSGDKSPFSMPGIEELRQTVKYGLMKKYYGIAQSMWEWTFSDDFEDMQSMDRGVQPERTLFRNGECCVFRDPKTEQCHILPLTYDGGINLYGFFSSWHPIPVGWDESKRDQYDKAISDLMELNLNAENSVIIRNDRFGTGDMDYIDQMIKELVECVLTDNQLIILSRMPIVFEVTQDNLLSAKNIFLQLAQGNVVTYKNLSGEKVDYVIPTGISIDTGLFELFDRFECQILDYLGIDCVPITKRAQQTVSEVTSNGDKIRLRREEKLRERERACEKMKEVLGVDVTVKCKVDEWQQEMMNTTIGNPSDYPGSQASEPARGVDEQ